MPTPSASKGGFSFSKLTFGVEIECYNVIREMLIEASTANGLQVRSEGYNHNDSRKYYKIVSDSSIQGNNTNEVVSPILKGKRGLSSLKAICDSLATIDARVNKSCGLHIHIGASSLSDEHYCRLVRNYQKLERVIDTFMPMSRRGNNSRWCHTLQGIDFSTCTNKEAGCDFFETRFGDLTPPGTLVSEDMTAQDLERMRENRRRARSRLNARSHASSGSSYNS